MIGICEERTLGLPAAPRTLLQGGAKCKMIAATIGMKVSYLAAPGRSVGMAGRPVGMPTGTSTEMEVAMICGTGLATATATRADKDFMMS